MFLVRFARFYCLFLKKFTLETKILPLQFVRYLAFRYLLDNIAIVGRLFSENKGIDALIRFVNSNKNIKTIILCGKEVWGHKTGDSLLAVYENGIDNSGRIISSKSPDPVLEVSKNEVNQFRNQVNIINKIGETNPVIIKTLVDSLKAQ